MDPRALGIETDPVRVAEDDVAPYRGLSAVESHSQFVDLMNSMDLQMRLIPVQEWYKAWRALDAVDDPGRWWERVPSE